MPQVSPKESALLVRARMFNDHLTLSIDTSGEPLHRRGWRKHVGKAPLRMDLARALVLVSGWDRESLLFDPMMGSGAILIEAACMAHRKVYCFGPTFRAEKSKTRRHLTEFWMVEPEVAFADLDDLMDLAEDMIRTLVERVLTDHRKDLESLDRETASLEAVTQPFLRMSNTPPPPAANHLTRLPWRSFTSASK